MSAFFGYDPAQSDGDEWKRNAEVTVTWSSMWFVVDDTWGHISDEATMMLGPDGTWETLASLKRRERARAYKTAAEQQARWWIACAILR